MNAAVIARIARMFYPAPRTAATSTARTHAKDCDGGDFDCCGVYAGRSNPDHAPVSNMMDCGHTTTDETCEH